MPASTQRFIDLDTSGAPVRESTFHLSILSQGTHTTDNIKNAIRTRVSKGGYPLEYQGSFPNSYQVYERRLRWASSIHRTFRIAEPNEVAPAEISQLDWIALNPVSNPWTAERRTEIRDLVKRELAEPGVKVHFLGATLREKAPLTLGRRDSTSPYSRRHWSQHVHSPRGGPNLGDMVLHDPQLKKQRTLVIELKKERETVFYRSTYY